MSAVSPEKFHELCSELIVLVKAGLTGSDARFFGCPETGIGQCTEAGNQIRVGWYGCIPGIFRLCCCKSLHTILGNVIPRKIM